MPLMSLVNFQNEISPLCVVPVLICIACWKGDARGSPGPGVFWLVPLVGTPLSFISPESGYDVVIVCKQMCDVVFDIILTEGTDEAKL